MRILQKLRSLLSRSEGVTSIEYGLIAGLIGLVVIAAIASSGSSLSARFNAIANAFSP